MRLVRAFGFAFVVSVFFLMLGVVAAAEYPFYVEVKNQITGDAVLAATVKTKIHGTSSWGASATTDSDGMAVGGEYEYNTLLTVEVTKGGYEDKTVDHLFAWWSGQDTLTVHLSQGSLECSDEIDNDGDGLIDYPEDPDCDSATDNTEATPVIAFLTNEVLQATPCSGSYMERGSFVDDISIRRYHCVTDKGEFVAGETYVVDSYVDVYPGGGEHCDGETLDFHTFDIGSTTSLDLCIFKETVSETEYDDRTKQLVFDSVVTTDGSCPTGFTSTGQYSMSSGGTFSHCVKIVHQQTDVGDCLIDENPKWKRFVDGQLVEVGASDSVHGSVPGRADVEPVYLVADISAGSSCDVDQAVTFEIYKGSNPNLWTIPEVSLPAGRDTGGYFFADFWPVWYDESPFDAGELGYYGFKAIVQGTTEVEQAPVILTVSKAPAMCQQGDCGDGEVCNPSSGLCVPQCDEDNPSCPGDLVCKIDLGRCVECLDDSYCSDDLNCSADWECVDDSPCVLVDAKWRRPNGSLATEVAGWGSFMAVGYADGDYVTLTVDGEPSCAGESIEFELYSEGWTEVPLATLPMTGQVWQSSGFYHTGWPPTWYIPSGLEGLLPGGYLVYYFEAKVVGQEGGEARSPDLRVTEPTPHCKVVECGPGEACNEDTGHCEDECIEQEDCPTGEYCDVETNYCVECLKDEDCDVESNYHCVEQSCVPLCETHAECVKASNSAGGLRMDYCLVEDKSCVECLSEDPEGEDDGYLVGNEACIDQHGNSRYICEENECVVPPLDGIAGLICTLITAIPCLLGSLFGGGDLVQCIDEACGVPVKQIIPRLTLPLFTEFADVVKATFVLLK